MKKPKAESVDPDENGYYHCASKHCWSLTCDNCPKESDKVKAAMAIKNKEKQ